VTPSVKDYYCPPDLYDVIYSDIRDDIPFWVGETGEARGPVLELCCGTGRVLIPCLEAGVDIDGLDLTDAMIEALRARLAARGLSADVALGDMRDFTRPRTYALITIPFNSFLHNPTQADQLATLRCCREHLAPGGRLMLNIFHPSSARLAELDGLPRLIKTVPHPAGGSARVIDAGRCDPVAQHIAITRTIELLDDAARVTATRETAFELRYVWKPEMELLLALAGFRRFAVEARTGYTKGFAPKPVLEDGDQLVWTAGGD
jgi:SAM-dependent methyltransferase